jgi:hypothetical protein
VGGAQREIESVQQATEADWRRGHVTLDAPNQPKFGRRGPCQSFVTTSGAQREREREGERERDRQTDRQADRQAGR